MAVRLGAFLIGFTILVPGTASARAEVRCSRAASLLASEEPQAGTPEQEAFLTELWGELGRCAADLLTERAAAGPGDLVAALASAVGPELYASAAPLCAGGEEAMALALEREWGGTFLVLEKDARGTWAVAWSIGELAKAHFAARDELGYWAYRTPGYHDGPLGGSVMSLPAARDRRPRFLVHAIAHAGMGFSVPGQISVWEWQGAGRVVPVFVKNYSTNVESCEVTLDGDLLKVTTKQEPSAFYTCGSCTEPVGLWNLRVTPDGVEDLGGRYEAPDIGLLDDVLVAASCGSRLGLAAPSVLDVLGERLARERGEGSSSCDSVGMLMSWESVEDGARRRVRATFDALSLTLEVEDRGGRPYVAAVALEEEASDE